MARKQQRTGRGAPRPGASDAALAPPGSARSLMSTDEIDVLRRHATTLSNGVVGPTERQWTDSRPPRSVTWIKTRVGTWRAFLQGAGLICHRRPANLDVRDTLQYFRRAGWMRDVPNASARVNTPCTQFIGTHVCGRPHARFGGRMGDIARQTVGLAISDPRTVEHICRNDWCVAADHLTILSLAENIRSANRRVRPTPTIVEIPPDLRLGPRPSASEILKVARWHQQATGRAISVNDFRRAASGLPSYYWVEQHFANMEGLHTALRNRIPPQVGTRGVDHRTYVEANSRRCPNGCAVWVLGRRKNGRYGNAQRLMIIDGRERHITIAHTVAYYAHNDGQALPHGWEIHHVCGNPICVRHEHLRPMPRGEHRLVDNHSAMTSRFALSAAHTLGLAIDTRQPDERDIPPVEAELLRLRFAREALDAGNPRAKRQRRRDTERPEIVKRFCAHNSQRPGATFGDALRALLDVHRLAVASGPHPHPADVTRAQVFGTQGRGDVQRPPMVSEVRFGG